MYRECTWENEETLPCLVTHIHGGQVCISWGKEIVFVHLVFYISRSAVEGVRNITGI